MAKDLRQFLSMVQEEHPDLFLTIREEVNSNNFEVSALLTLLEKKHQKKIVMFEKALSLDESRSVPLVTKVSYTRELCALALGLDRENHRMGLVEEFAKRENSPGRLETVAESKAPCREVVWEGESANLLKLPVPMYHEKDAGAYHTMMCVMKGLDQDFYNITFTKNLVKGPKKMLVSASPHHHIEAIITEYEKQKMRAPIIVVLGHHPAFNLSCCIITPLGNNDYVTASSFLGEPLRVVPSRTWGKDFMVPADAEIIIEGEVVPGAREEQNPFGEIAGYYQVKAMVPVIEVTAITMKKDAVVQQVYPGHAEHWTLGMIPKEGSVFNVIKRNIPGVKAVHLPPSGCGRFSCVISLEKEFENEPRKAAMTAFTEMPNLKMAIVVDADVDVFNEQEVMWAVATRTHWDKDLEVIRKVQDFRKWLGDAVAIIDATRPRGVNFPDKNEVPAEAIRKAEGKWKGKINF